MDAPQRLTALEVQMKHLDKCVDDTRHEVQKVKDTVQGLQKNIWWAHGALAVLVVIAPIVVQVVLK